MARTSLFIYGLVHATEERTTTIPGIEHGGVRSDVRVIAVDGVGALVSDVTGKDPVFPSRKNLETHTRVLREFIAGIIPMSFGQIVKSPAELRRFLKKRRAAILGELARLDNKVEMGLRVRWDVENIFDYFVREDRELAAARDRIFRGGTPTQAEKLELGRLFEERLGEERERHTDLVVERMSSAAADLKVNPPKGETTVMDLVMLVDRSRLEEFERRVYKVAEGFPGQYSFDFNGPWAPFSFVELDVHADA